MSKDSGDSAHLTPSGAQQLLSSVPSRPRREFKAFDHLMAVAVIAASFVAGQLALSGYGWLSIAPAIVAFLCAQRWFAARQRRVNEPRFRGGRIVLAIFTVWLVLPIWQNLVHQETAPWPDSLILSGLAPLLWLGYYLFLLIRR